MASTGRSAGTGPSVPSLGLSARGLPHFDAHDLVLMSIELGVRHIATSPDYDNESAVGGALSGSGVERSEVFVSSVIGCHDGDRERLFDSFDVTLDLLGLRRLDLLFLRPDDSEAHWIAACDALHGLLEEGVVSRLGLDLDDLSGIAELGSHAPFDAVAMSSHPGRSQLTARRWCGENGWEFITRSPFGPEDPPDLVEVTPIIADLASGHGVSPEQVVLAWAISRPDQAVVFPSSSPDDLFDRWESRRVELTTQEIVAIDGLDPADT